MLMTIKKRWSGDVIWEGDAETMVDALRKALNEGKSLQYANLTRANLTRANLTRANLTRANLTRANLTDANLTDANLTRANLTRANLTRANLTDANLTRANLTRANLTDANLIDANLTDANTALARADVRSILTAAPHEVAGLKAALIAGQVNGQLYSGPCACLLGTIANVRHCDVNDLVSINPELRQNSSRPAERWFMGVKPGQTPENHPIAALTLDWIEQWEADARIVALAYGSQ